MIDRSLIKPGLLTFGLLVASAAGYVLFSSTPETTLQVNRLAVRQAPLEQRIGLTGHIVPGTLLTVTAPFEGRVQDKWVEEGQSVARGQKLLRLDPSQLNIQMRDALAERLKARSAVQLLDGWDSGEEMARARRALSTSQMSLADTERKLAETQGLLERGIVARMEVDSLVQQARTQRLDLKSARAELQQVTKKGQGEHRQIADMQLTNATTRHEALLALERQGEISAPFAGIIVEPPGSNPDQQNKPVQRGARVSLGQSLFGLASLEQLNVVAKVDEVDINQLREGMPVQISGDGFEGIVLTGAIKSVGAQAIAAQMQSEGASYSVTVALPALTQSQQQRLRLGMSARLSILAYQNPQAMVVPATAIAEDEHGAFVMFSQAQDQPFRRQGITLGRPTAQGVEVFGMEAGWIRREVTMDN
ncbi:MAG TPA: HlyD family efflux transporter periplasmic adaptor subunit [Pseudomonas sp.]|uniref:efflux RND transporter periplasmic adaptor subunit n=1 Tax=Pseudomonas sp. TaxID=306 RepID=UPI002EDA4FE1